MMSIGSRIEDLLRDKGWSQAELARRVGISTQAVWKLVKGDGQGSKHLHKIARELGTTPEFLEGDQVGQSGEARLQYRAEPPEVINADTVELAEFDVAFGMGSSYIHDAPVKFRMRTFSRAWVRQFTDSPFDQLFWATGNGTSMMPAILENDILLIDTNQRTPRMADQFWALDMQGMGSIKALRPAKDGGMQIISINPDWPNEVAYDGEMNVVGRVVAIVRKV